MGFFSGQKKGISKKPTEQWTRERVLRWLEDIGMEKYNDKFKAVTGKRLLQLSRADIMELVALKVDADLLTDAINELRLRDGVQNPDNKPQADAFRPEEAHQTPEVAHLQEVEFERQGSLPPVKTGLTHAGASSVSSGSPAFGRGGHMPPRGHLLLEDLNSLPQQDMSSFDSFFNQNQQSPYIQNQNKHPSNTQHSSCTSDGLRAPGVLKPILEGKQGVAENAKMLSHLVGGQDVVTDLFAFMNHIGIQGMGLVEATERSPIVGYVIGALWELHDLAIEAKGNRANCVQLNTYCHDVLRVFDAEGKRLSYIDEECVKTLLGLVEQGIRLVESFVVPGWFARMTHHEKSIDDFQGIHNEILTILKAEKVDTLPNGRQLTYGEYRDSSRPLRRLLKQLGSGSLEAGMNVVLTQEQARNSVSQLIGISTQDIVKDLQQMAAQPELDLMSTQTHSSLSGGEYSPMSAQQNGGRNKEYQTIFTQYDKNHSGALEFEELRSVLADLGMLDGVKPTEIEAFTVQQFHAADVDGDERVDYEEFVAYYQSISTTKARRELRSALGPQAEKDLKKIFLSFVSFGIRQTMDDMDGAKFSKLCRDCKLLNRSFTTIDVDLIFAKVKVKGQRRINFDGFLSALFRIAEKKGQPLEEVVSHILNAGGPTVKCTKTDYVKFHDDKSTYTGVYSRGGPTNVDPSKDLSSLLDRSEADVRGRKKRGSFTGDDVPLSARGPAPSRQASGMSQLSAETRGTSEVFSSSRPNSRRESYAGSTDGGRSRNASMTGEGHEGLTPPQSRRVSSNGTAAEPTSRRVSGNGGLPPAVPRSSPRPAPATASAPTPPSHSTSAPAATAPEPQGNVDLQASLESLANVPPPEDLNGGQLRAPDSGSFCAPAVISQLSPVNTPRSAFTEKNDQPVKRAAVQDVFAAFASFGGRASSDGAADLDGAKFAKLCRECNLLAGSFNSTAVDIIFSRVKSKGARKISFKEFEKALQAIADEKKVSLEAVQRQILASGGPQRSRTTPTSHVRLHDDKSSYTGVYKAGGPSVVDKPITLQSLTDRTNTSHPASQPRMNI